MRQIIALSLRRFSSRQRRVLPSINCPHKAHRCCSEMSWHHHVRSIATCTTRLKLHHYKPTVVSSPQHAELFVGSLGSLDRSVLAEALEKYEATNEGGQLIQPPTFNQLKLAAYQTAIPFIGFGFLDNAIMIIAGEYIELKIGVAFGISTMAAAALGNIVSDVSGLGLAGYVESVANRLGFQGPKMTSAQQQMTRTVLATNLGRGIGMVFGCIVGMFPLFFYKDKKEQATEHAVPNIESKDTESKNTVQS